MNHEEKLSSGTEQVQDVTWTSSGWKARSGVNFLRNSICETLLLTVTVVRIEDTIRSQIDSFTDTEAKYESNAVRIFMKVLRQAMIKNENKL